ncbi:MAG: quinol dehydrogenase ferredoxin subunit NapH [Gammaproteobacteria bacterium CG22_combo_CG10-13_8_21_14_all_40_8]|nr:MAG: quinol dehydrogenase ferredoxin subunit NapH [Gammaproteobacteria bacterium CG22_combo_CG10-13_8_21_14_all_40_8]
MQTTQSTRNWLKTHRILLLRRFCQLSLTGLFLLGPLFEIWWFKGTLSASLIFNTIPLTDPLLLEQVIATGTNPEVTLWLGFIIVLLFYFVIGGRSYCAWVCPVNMVTDSASWLRKKLNIKTNHSFSKNSRYWMLAMILVASFVNGSLIWEQFNPVTLLSRSLIFGLNTGFILIGMIFLFDLLVSKRGWCGHLCPMGANYRLIGQWSLTKVQALNRKNCDDCMDCFKVCPEPHVIKPALKGNNMSTSIIMNPECNNCGRCIEICPQKVFKYSSRWAINLEKSA